MNVTYNWSVVILISITTAEAGWIDVVKIRYAKI